MENKKITIPVIIILVIAVVSLGIAFATFSTVLNINGSADVAATSWDIYFTSGPNGSKPISSVTVPIENISTSGSALNHDASFVATSFTWDAYFQKPNDRIVYTIYVQNGGSYNAQVSSINMPSITCTTNPNNVCSHLHYGLYTDTAGQNDLSTSFTVNAGATEVFYLIAWLDTTYGNETGSGLVSTDVVTNSITATVTFEQASSAVTNNTNSGNSGGNGEEQEPDFQVLVPAYNDEELGSLNQDWGTMSELKHALNINTVPTAYLKRQDSENDEVSLCVNTNSTELCFSENDVETLKTSLASSCSTLGFTSIDTQFDDGFYQGTRCTKEDGTFILQDTSDHLGYIELRLSYNNIGCNIVKEYSEESNQYELLQYDCYYNY